MRTWPHRPCQARIAGDTSMSPRPTTHTHQNLLQIRHIAHVFAIAQRNCNPAIGRNRCESPVGTKMQAYRSFAESPVGTKMRAYRSFAESPIGTKTHLFRSQAPAFTEVSLHSIFCSRTKHLQFKGKPLFYLRSLPIWQKCSNFAGIADTTADKLPSQSHPRA